MPKIKENITKMNLGKTGQKVIGRLVAYWFKLPTVGSGLAVDSFLQRVDY